MALRMRKNRATVPTDVERVPGCPLNRCMELISGAWAAHVLWFLSAQPRRFSELRRDIPAISARVLSQRLRELEAKGVVTRTVVPTSPPSVEYALTELGRELYPVIAAIAAVGRKLALLPGAATQPPQPQRKRLLARR
jgi:DNA-binding HxlR family transcriptional regulator